MRRLAVHLSLVAAACVPNYSGMKAPPMPDDMVEVAAPEPVTWHTTVQVLAKNDLPIEDLRRQFGWIETQVRTVDQTAASAWADCSDPLQNAIIGPDRVAVLVRVDSDGSNKSKIHVEAEWSYSLDSEVTCQSKGIWEQTLLSKITDAVAQTVAESDEV